MNAVFHGSFLSSCGVERTGLVQYRERESYAIGPALFKGLCRPATLVLPRNTGFVRDCGLYWAHSHWTQADGRISLRDSCLPAHYSEVDVISTHKLLRFHP
ncbi:hypothetical protein RMSM_04331 [Rhodopirellula maiorica SM1]|uniref:Uncharacterized protein n=1 Tax=Rhodopirellula maiorica SM1 TaxID=1265738 RepID=M5RHD3_9BACT|nr:hypothetical protein RMSM_04331 [Rhodopirellula maiorica SM1]